MQKIQQGQYGNPYHHTYHTISGPFVLVHRLPLSFIACYVAIRSRKGLRLETVYAVAAGRVAGLELGQQSVGSKPS